MKQKMIIALNILAIVSCIALAIKFIVIPASAKILFANEYKELMFQCDSVMRDHMIAKNRVIHEKNEEAIMDLKSAEIGLLSCHDYDKLRKKMMIMGLTAEEISYIGLEAIEERTKDLMKYVEIHEFKY
jgi:hypothetical protein